MPNSLEDQLADLLGPAMERRKARQYGVSLKHDITGTPGTGIYSHGPGGLLSFPGVDPVVFHTVMGPNSILGQIPTQGSPFTNPTYFTITGVGADTGSEMSGVCDNAPVAGLMKGCLTTAPFGRYERATQLVDIGRLGARTDRADPMDLRLVGTPFGSAASFMGGPSDPAAPGDVLTNETARKFWERAVSFHRLLSKQVWAGTPANNAVGGGYKEFPGLSVLVNTGYVDAETGQTCSNMDSYVSNFNYGRIDQAGSQIVQAITNAYHQVKTKAEMSGMMPVRWAFAMRPELFYEITNIWPCNYLTMGCSFAPNSDNRLNIDATDAVRFRDEMRAGKYLMIEGERIDVIVDSAIPEKNGNNSGGSFPRGCFASDIYLLPFSVVGGQSVLFMEYFEYNNPSVNDAFAGMVLGRIDGPWLTWPRQTNMCVQFQSRIEPRLVLRTPWLAARIQNVAYCPIQHTAQAFPTDPYYVETGKSSRQGPSFFALWQS